KKFTININTTEYLTFERELTALKSWTQTNAILTLPLAESIVDGGNVTATLEATFTNSTYLLFANIAEQSQQANANNLSHEGIGDGDTLQPTSTTVQGPQRAPASRSAAFEVPIWLILCYSTILLFAIVGNLLVIIILAQNRRMRTITNVFLLNLAISDILLGVFCMPVTLVGTLLRNFIFGEYFCKLIQFSQAASVAVSSWTLVAISCERYYAICHPLRSRRWQTRSHAYKIIASIWCGSMLCMTPIALFSQLMPTSRQGYHKCRENWPSYALPYERPYNIFLDLVLLVLPLAILSVAYILITRTLYVGMRIEKAMIFGGGSCNGKLNSDEMYTTLQRKNGTSIYGVGSMTKGVFVSTTAPSTPTSSMTTLASTSSSVSRFKSQLSLRRHGHVVQTNINTKNNGAAVGLSGSGGAGGTVGVAAASSGVGGMRSHLMHSRAAGVAVGGGNMDETIQEVDVYQQKSYNQPSPYNGAHHQRMLQQQSSIHQKQQLQLQQQPQNHCHNYHQQIMHHAEYGHEQHPPTLTHHVSDKLFCVHKQNIKV
uniref:Gastrin/cholecystokinin type B receptor n=1 Tax=Stomoxys calcitrans TaxID=35570 RepID=A0A1I8PI39_STOCA